MSNEYMEKLRKEQLKLLDHFVTFCDKNKLEYFLIGGTLLGAVRHKGYIPWDDDIDVAMPRKDYEKFIKTYKNTDNFILDYYTTNFKYWLPFAKIRNNKTVYLENLQKNYDGPSGIWIDIFPFDNANKEKSFLEFLQFKFTNLLRRAVAYKSHLIPGESHIYSHVLGSLLSLFPYKFLNWLRFKIMTINHNDDSKYVLSLGGSYGYGKEIFLRDEIFPTKKLLFEGKKYNVPNSYESVLTKIYGKNYMDLPPVEKRVTHNPIKVKFEDGKEINFEEK